MDDNKQFFRLYWHQLRLVFMVIVGMRIFYHLFDIISILIQSGSSDIDFPLYIREPYISPIFGMIALLIGLISSTRIFD